MTKAKFLTKVQSKPGFHSIISDEAAQDNIAGDPIEKRYLYINHTNADGTMGKTFVFYLYETATDTASFYNVEAEALDAKEPSTNQKKLDALTAYLAGKYASFFINRYDLNQPVAEADVYTLAAGKLVRKTVLVFKKGANPINDLDVTIG